MKSANGRGPRLRCAPATVAARTRATESSSTSSSSTTRSSAPARTTGRRPLRSARAVPAEGQTAEPHQAFAPLPRVQEQVGGQRGEVDRQHLPAGQWFAVHRGAADDAFRLTDPRAVVAPPPGAPTRRPLPPGAASRDGLAGREQTVQCGRGHARAGARRDAPGRLPARQRCLCAAQRPVPQYRPTARRRPRHLLDLGHRTVWHSAGPPRSCAAERRRKAWQPTLDQAVREVPPPNGPRTPFTEPESGSPPTRQ
jgi:hypothetical protein